MSTARLRRERLVALRKAAGLSQADLAALIDPPGRERRVGEWERGEVQLRPLHLVRLAAALQVDPLELLDVDPGDPPLIALRFAAGLTLERASLASGLSTSAYRRLETGVVRSNPQPATSRLLADALRVPTARLAQALARSRSERHGNR